MKKNIDDAQLDQADARYLFGLPENKASSTVLGWLTGKHSRRSKLAMKLLATMGQAATGLLLSKALAPRKSPQQRIRLLMAIEQIGNPLDSQQWLGLLSQAQRFEGEVKHQIMRLVTTNRQRTMEARASSDSPVVAMPNPYLPSQAGAR
jgi:hypothetical protein